MTLKIEITVPEEFVGSKSASTYLDSALSALGFARALRPVVLTREAEEAMRAESMKPGEVEVEVAPHTTAPLTDVQQNVVDGTFGVRSATDEERAAVGIEPKRQRGQPSPGRKRRTAAEIAEDEAADNSEIGAAVNKAIGHVSEAPADDEAAQAQDQADEAAEAAANRTSDAPTLDDLRRLMGAVQRAHGMTVAIGIPAMLGKPIVELTPEELPVAIARVQGLLNHGPTDEVDKGRPFDAETVDAPAATADDVRAAMLRYAAKYEGYTAPPGGPIDGSKIQVTSADSAKVFSMLFGEGVVKVSAIPNDPTSYAKAVSGIEEMIAKNPFKR